MSNIYLKIINDEKNSRSQTVDFPGLKIVSPCQFWRAPAQANTIEF